MLKIFFVLLSISLGGVTLQAGEVNPESALQRLIEGNERYVNDKLLHPDRTRFRRESLTLSQEPFATIVGCSDSRVSPEIVFDQGIGDLFVVRVAGNVVGPIELDSVDFSAQVLGSSIILVLGHENCGAVKAVLDGQAQGIPAVAELIEPAVIKAKNIQGGNPLENAVKTNVRQVVQHLQNSSIIKQFIQDKKITVVGGYYNLGSGKVEFLK